MKTNLATSKDSDKYVLLIVGEQSERQIRMVELLLERYGDKLEIVRQKEFDKLQGIEANLVIFDEYVDECKSVSDSDFISISKRKESPYWQRKRW